jgi:glycosyltransferase involved in cell wall biosynthesis
MNPSRPTATALERDSGAAPQQPAREASHERATSAAAIRVLLIAEQANPEWVSVPLVGWSFCDAIRRVVSAHIVTHVRNREALLRAGLIEHKDFTSIDTESISRPLNRFAYRFRGGEGKGWTTITAFQSLAYYAFERAVWKTFGAAIAAREFDVVHRVTPLSPTSPSTIAKRVARAGVPFIVGPLNGGLPWPAGFESRRLAEREWFSYVRNIYKLLPSVGATQRYSKVILVGSRATESQLSAKHRHKARYLPENGIDPARFFKHRTKRAALPLRGIFVGRLVPYKCPDLLLRASLPWLKQGRLKLTIVGDGPLLAAMKALVEREGVSEHVQFTGWISHKDVQDTLIDSDFLALPSIREFGGGVVLEAMACGVPAIVADYGGPAELVDAETGFKVPFTDEASLVANLSSTLGRLVDDPSLLDARGAAAIAHIQAHFSWSQKANRIVSIYREVLGDSARSSGA